SHSPLTWPHSLSLSTIKCPRQRWAFHYLSANSLATEQASGGGNGHRQAPVSNRAKQDAPKLGRNEASGYICANIIREPSHR
ncbi:hypothetical protein KUCAC02_013234, partial [Chaenocephalus aceratus]